MHPVSNQVEIPTEQIEQALVSRAVPGFTGSVTIGVRVLPTAALEIEYPIETRTVQQIGVTRDLLPAITNERVARVRRMLAENAAKFRLGTKLSAIVGNFKNGELSSLEIKEVE